MLFRSTGTVQLTNDGRPKEAPWLTDGSRVFFMSDSAAGTEARQVSVKGGESIALPLPVKDAVLVDISPDHTELLLCRGGKSYSTPCELWVAPLLGGSACGLLRLLFRPICLTGPRMGSRLHSSDRAGETRPGST